MQRAQGLRVLTGREASQALNSRGRAKASSKPRRPNTSTVSAQTYIPWDWNAYTPPPPVWVPDTAPFNFLLLPAELRLAVYDIVFDMFTLKQNLEDAMNLYVSEYTLIERRNSRRRVSSDKRRLYNLVRTSYEKRTRQLSGRGLLWACQLIRMEVLDRLCNRSYEISAPPCSFKGLFKVGHVVDLPLAAHMGTIRVVLPLVDKLEFGMSYGCDWSVELSGTRYYVNNCSWWYLFFSTILEDWLEAPGSSIKNFEVGFFAGGEEWKFTSRVGTKEQAKILHDVLIVCYDRNELRPLLSVMKLDKGVFEMAPVECTV